MKWLSRKWPGLIPMLAALAGSLGEAVKYRSTEEAIPKEKSGRMTFDVTIQAPPGVLSIRSHPLRGDVSSP